MEKLLDKKSDINNQISAIDEEIESIKTDDLDNNTDLSETDISKFQKEEED